MQQYMLMKGIAEYVDSQKDLCNMIYVTMIIDSEKGNLFCHDDLGDGDRPINMDRWQ